MSLSERNRKWASELTDDELLAEFSEVEAAIANGFGDHSGSPGEWYYERADEVRMQIDKRLAARLALASNESDPNDPVLCSKRTKRTEPHNALSTEVDK